MQNKKRLRCPLCQKLPKNLADQNIGYAYSCLCRLAMLGRFSFDEETATNDWNRLVAIQREKMAGIIPRKRKKKTFNPTIITMRQLHDYCKLFPPCTAEEYILLKESIEKNGLIEPLVLLDGKILDGQNRDMVCQELGLEPETVEYIGDDPLGFVLSKNLHRRHLNESQRAMIASELANLCRGKPKPANLPVYESQQSQGITQNRRVSQAEAAKMLNVSERSVRTAAKVKKEASPEAIQQVKEGKKTLNAAMTEGKPKEKPQSNPRKKTIVKAEEPEGQDNVLVFPLPFERQSMFDEICRKVFLVAERPEQLAMYYEFCETIRLMHDYLNSPSK